MLGLPRSSGHSPLFQVFYDYRQGAREKLSFGDVEFEVGEADLGESAYDIVLDVTEGAAGSLIVLRGQEYLYGVEQMQSLMTSYLALLRSFSDSPQASVDDVDLFEPQQIQAALDVGQGISSFPTDFVGPTLLTLSRVESSA